MAARRFTVKLTPDEVSEARSVGRQRHALLDPTSDVVAATRLAIAEKAVATGLRRPWDGQFKKIGSWKIWKRLNVAVTELTARPVGELLASLTVSETAVDTVPIVLVIDRDAPTFGIAGWIFGKDAKQDKYRNSTGPGWLVPQSDLRPAWELKREQRSKGRLNQADPADDFAGHGRYPGQLDSDDGQHGKAYGVPSPARWALPCRRCRTVVPVGALTVWSIRTGWIHAEAAECKASRAANLNK